MDQQIDIATQYVRTLSDDDSYTDGYQRSETSASGATIAANLLEFWTPAYSRFKLEQRLTEEQKKLKHYLITFYAHEDRVVVLFRPLFLPRVEKGEVVGRLRATLGKELKISIARKDKQVIEVKYAKQ